MCPSELNVRYISEVALYKTPTIKFKPVGLVQSGHDHHFIEM